MGKKRRKDAFITRHFLLGSKRAQGLYHDFAKAMPIIDYHCHLPPDEIANDRQFENLTQAWLHGDHYKWRAMRTNGVAERFCTGDASDWEKFLAWAQTVPKCLRNPLYHWTHLELKRPFGISDRLLGPQTATSVWNECNELLGEADFSVRGILAQMNVQVVCTTDDPVDNLEHHLAIAGDPGCAIQVRPTWRPDKGMAVDDPAAFNAWVDRLGAAANVDIRDFTAYLSALRARHDAFHQAGCRLSDHGLDTVYAESYSESQIAAAFAKIRGGQALDQAERDRFKSAMLHEGALMDHAKGWVQQFHIGALRNNNQRLFKALGPDKGFDSIGDANYAVPLSRFLDRLDVTDQLARTIVYNLNPRDNELLAAMIGNFQDGSVAGKLQLGSGWWFLDQKDGMERQLEAVSNLSLLSRFVGMTTDSRSFLSYTRHEYFRRTLCNLLGAEMTAGSLPDDLALVGAMVQDICYHNAAAYFDFGLEAKAGSPVGECAKAKRKPAAKR
ncbi:MAG: glucuronate isomerase [Planctomycetes bacterium]|nr:glucuronate isomerase [Planctomycetota bacterium]